MAELQQCAKNMFQSALHIADCFSQGHFQCCGCLAARLGGVPNQEADCALAFRARIFRVRFFPSPAGTYFRWTASSQVAASLHVPFPLCPWLRRVQLMYGSPAVQLEVVHAKNGLHQASVVGYIQNLSTLKTEHLSIPTPTELANCRHLSFGAWWWLAEDFATCKGLLCRGML